MKEPGIDPAEIGDAVANPLAFVVAELPPLKIPVALLVPLLMVKLTVAFWIRFPAAFLTATTSGLRYRELSFADC